MIIPAIIPRSLEHLRESVKKIGFPPLLQIDVVDGKFVSYTSWPYEPPGKVSDVTEVLNRFSVEVDLMVEDPLSAAKEWLEAGTKRIIFHIETLNDPTEAIALCRELNKEVGLAIQNDTPLEQVYPYIDQVDCVQLMGISEIGRQGQPFDPRVLERITTLKKLYPSVIISIDGGVNETTILDMKRARASRFVCGSAIMSAENPKEAFEKLLKIVVGESRNSV